MSLVWIFFFYIFFFFSSRRRHTRCREVSWARRCVQETVSTQSTWGGALVSTGGCFGSGCRQSSNSLNWKLNVIAEDKFEADYALAAQCSAGLRDAVPKTGCSRQKPGLTLLSV
eukprot:TRINITY_DN16197_c0_g1_i4.p4 TRINITY_DN16197_c0_g1~~TRINITY_DN16197_c0_g1_i4.p4  ORF type:complete len:114 (+),score=34.78 TRINITY_DN16197_c0_g1_i4:83-424(+)